MIGGKSSYRDILARAREDGDIVGLILGGSRGKGIQTKYSDYDVYLIAKRGRTQACKLKYRLDRIDQSSPLRTVTNDGFVEMVIMDISEFKDYASFGGPQSWDRYNFAHLKAQLDKTGAIQKLIDCKSKVPPRVLRQFAEYRLDAYVNFVYRSLKCQRDGNHFGSRLDAAREIPFFIDALFALDARIAPYYKYLEWELTRYPVRSFRMASSEILDSLIRILDSADRVSQQRILKAANHSFRRKGYRRILNSWGRKLDWMLSWQG